MEPVKGIIWTRKWVEVNTDPQRRCYYGVHAKSEWRWTGWEVLEYVTSDEAERRLKFWRELSAYAEGERGPSGRSEQKFLPEGERP